MNAKASEAAISIPSTEDLIDQFGDVCLLRDEFAPTERLYQKLREQLKDLTADAEPDAAFSLAGNRYKLAVSARKFESTPDVPAVRKKLGAATFLLVAQVTKKALESFMLKPDIERLCVSAQTGSRTFDPTPIP